MLGGRRRGHGHRAAGLAGRCQELALGIAPALEGREAVAFAAVASDGGDFIPGVLGGVVGPGTAPRLRAAGVSWRRALSRHDSHPALRAAGALVTGSLPATNLCDLYLLCQETA